MAARRAQGGALDLPDYGTALAELQRWSVGAEVPPEHVFQRLICLAQDDRRKVEAMAL